MTSRRNFLKTLTVSTPIILSPMERLWAGLLMDDPAYKMTLLRRNVGVFTERGGTIAWMVSPKGMIVVDSQFPDQANHLIEELKKKSDRKVDLLINTHHHGDHSSGNIAFKGLAKKVVAHENARINQETVAKKRGKEDTQLYPDTTFSKEWAKKVGDESMKLRYFGPAHTNGDAVIHFEHANIVHLGDLLFNKRPPYVDRSTGANIHNWIKVLDQVLATFDNETIYIFGHAAQGHEVTGSAEDIKAKQGFLGKLLKYVESSIKAGKSKDEILNSPEIPGAENWNGRGLEWGLTAAYEELKK